MSDAVDLLWPPFLVALCLIGIHAYFGIEVLRRKVIFVDLALAQSDENRKRWIVQMTGQSWDDVRCYHLGIDTSSLPLPDIAEMMIDFAHRRSSLSTFTTSSKAPTRFERKMENWVTRGPLRP